MRPNRCGQPRLIPVSIPPCHFVGAQQPPASGYPALQIRIGLTKQNGFWFVVLLLVGFALQNIPAARAQPVSPNRIATLAQGVVNAANKERKRRGLPLVRSHPALMASAQGHVEDMVAHHYISHSGRDSSSAHDRARALGYPRYALENIAWGWATPQAAVQAWMRSKAGHRENLLNPRWGEIGVGVAYDPMRRKRLWVLVMGEPDPEKQSLSPTGNRLRFVEPPARTTLLAGEVALAVSNDPLPRSSTVVTQIRLDNRTIATLPELPTTFRWDTHTATNGEHQLLLVRRDNRTGREYVTDRTTVTVGNASAP